MADVDIRSLAAGEFVLHFGGRPNEVDAYTFSNSLVAFSEALREINSQLDPDHSIEITIEGTGPGSFRAKIKTATKSLKGLFKSSMKELLIGILAAFLYERYLSENKVTITVQDDSYVVQYGHDRIIIPRQ